MPDLPKLPIPSDLYYDIENQVWARLENDGSATVGITQLGIQLSGEIYMCRAKRVGTEVDQGATVAVVELAKAIVAVKSPVAGTVAAYNQAVRDKPALVHRDPYGAGWIARLTLKDFAADQAQLVHGAAALTAMRAHAAEHAGEFVPATTPGWRDPDPS